MENIRSGNYGGDIHTRNDGGGFDVYFLYNMNDPTHSHSTGDVSDRKTYKSKKTAVRKVNAWVASKQRGFGPA